MTTTETDCDRSDHDASVPHSVRNGRPASDHFVEMLRAHSRRYHDQHPFHVRMNAGQLSRRQLRGWVANRFYYQENIPRKDAAILSNCPDLEVRRRWIRRIVDHDGTAAGEGGIEAWLRLGEAAGLTREEVRDHRHLVPGVRFAVAGWNPRARADAHAGELVLDRPAQVLDLLAGSG